MLKIFVVEDEQFARQELIYLLKNTGTVEIIGEAESMHEALWEINDLQPDAVFLDIELAKGNGIDLARQFSNMKKQPMIVFATAYDHYALDAFELEAVDYLVKPIDEARLHRTVAKLLRLHKSDLAAENQNDTPSPIKTLTAKDGDKIVIIQTADILYIGTENRKAYIKTKNGKYGTDLLLYEVMKKLNNNFLQVHRGFIVNIKQISAIEPWFNRTYTLLLKDGSEVPVSRTYTKTLKEVLEL